MGRRLLSTSLAAARSKQLRRALHLEPLEARLALAITLAPSTFEIDGDTAVNHAGIDWDSISSSENFATKADLTKSGNDDALGQGSSENDQNVTVVTGSIPNSKADLSASLFYSEVVSNQVFLDLGWRRATTSGTVNFDFEINQTEVTFPTPPFKAVSVNLNRTVGDLLITYDFDGGNQVNLGYRTWNGSAWSASTVLGGFAIAAVSSNGLFGEASINLTAAGILPTDPSDPNFELESFSQAWVRSRASTSFNSEIKDIIAPIHVNITNAITIEGTKFNDLDGNGVQGAREPGLQGWTIFLDTNGNGTLDNGEASTTTDSDGHYDFGLRAPGSYKLAESAQAGWRETYPNSGTSGAVLTTAGTYEWTFTAAAMDQVVRDFGNQLESKTTEFGGLKFLDTNGNGIQQNGEPGVGNWTIQLWNDVDGNGLLNTNIDTLRGSTQTSSTLATLGRYRFSVDTAFGSTGKYILHEVQQAGYVETAPTTGDYAVTIAWTSGSNPTVTSNPLGPVGDSLGQVAPFNLDFGNFATDARIQLTPSTATNAVGQNHTVTATVQQNLGNGFVSAPNGTVVVFTLTNSNGAGATFVSDGVDSNGDGNSGNDAVVTGGVCSVQIVSATAGTVTINGTTTFTVAGQSVTRDTDPATTPTSGSGGSGPVSKIYVDASIALSPLTATNTTTEPHTITATVKQNLGAGAGFVNAPNGTVVVFSLTNSSGATATFVADGIDSNGDGNSGNDAVISNGVCSIQIVSNTAGSVVINATTSGLIVGGVALVRDTNPATTSIPAGPNGTGPANKTYAAPNLVVVKTADSSTVHLSRDVTNYAGYTLRVTNTGQGTAFNVLLDDDLPDPDANLTWYISDTNHNAISVSGSTITQDQTNSFGSGDYLHSIVGSLAADPDGAGGASGGSFTIHVSAVIPLSYLSSGGSGTLGDTFEIDGDMIVNHGGIDWNSPSVTSSPNYGAKTDLSKSGNDDALGQGSSENDTQITVVTGSIPNSKADLTQSLFYSETIRNPTTLQDEVVLHLGWSRATTSGTVNFDFEINQEQTVFPTAPFKAVKVNLIRTEGDLLITYDFGGGNNVVLNSRTWNGTSWGAPMSLGAFATAAVSTSTLFGEASINLTKAGILLTDPNDPNYKLEAFSQAWVRSRASSSFSSEIKDIIAPVHVNINNGKTVTLNNTAYAAADNNAQVSGSASIDVTNIPASTSASTFSASGPATQTAALNSSATTSSTTTALSKSSSSTTLTSSTTPLSRTAKANANLQSVRTAVHDIVFSDLDRHNLGSQLHDLLILLAKARRRIR